MHPFRHWLDEIASQESATLQLAKEFFVIFSRFEYALKQAGFVRGNNHVQPDWNRFAEQYGEVFGNRAQNNQSVREAIRCFRQEPPRRQVLRSGQLGWEHTQEDQQIMRGEREPTLPWLTIMVRRFRNNLFHGSKKMFDDRHRDLDLLEASFVLLGCWLDLDENVKRRFIIGRERLSVDLCSADSTTA